MSDHRVAAGAQLRSGPFFAHKVVPLFTAVALACGASLASAEADRHVGEDGKTYVLDHTAAQSSWLLGKIDPEVVRAAKEASTVDVSVHIARPAPRANAGDPVEAIKARYREQVDALGQQMRSIVRSYRPAESLPI